MDDILRHIPQRPPAVIIDEVIIIEDGKKANGYIALAGNESFFRGHFPGKPTMPGVMILEAMGQTISYLLSSSFPGKLGVFAGFDRVRFKKFVKPGDLLKLEIEVLSIKHKIGKATGLATVDSSVVAQAELIFAFTEAV